MNHLVSGGRFPYSVTNSCENCRILRGGDGNFSGLNTALRDAAGSQDARKPCSAPLEAAGFRPAAPILRRSRMTVICHFKTNSKAEFAWLPPVHEHPEVSRLGSRQRVRLFFRWSGWRIEIRCRQKNIVGLRINLQRLGSVLRFD